MGPSPATPAGQSLIVKVMMKVMKVVVVVVAIRIRLEICHKNYTTGFLGQKIYTLKKRKL